ncbi:succinate dehydrogenase, cytochrome b556 subunit [Methylocystis sp. B8]|uniref:succinate dehydrogenase, cytochrome b556 subunit n=1 Tax=Methylocystis sp. B8 TaxID=544938 RepID=UPI0010FD1C20|nr:succinate dehydrogenase, cytochrome b556 subunit [Methylocystis sp. B8]TLG79100.1 succinate dehydrogenase, cytochrome b556 subunit [Methylocystis sp. B8]
MADADIDRLAARRPLSPHLTIFKPILTMMMSIAHRITGAGLYVGMAFLTLFLLGAAIGGGAFSAVSWIASGFIGNLIILLIVWAIFHHLLGGVRHALWDRGLYMDPRGRELLAQGTLVGGILLTVLVLIFKTLAS